jgi:hypothetical protein
MTADITPTPLADLTELTAPDANTWLYADKTDGTPRDRKVKSTRFTLATAGAVTVADRTALKALSTATVTSAVLRENGRSGVFIFRSGNYASLVTADPLEGIYIAANDTASSSGAWVRQYNGPLDIRWFGASPGSSDSQPAIAAAYTLLETLNASVTEGAIGEIYLSAQNWTIDSGISFSKPVVFRCHGTLRYTPTSGAALIIGAAAPTGGQNTGYSIEINGMRAVNGNSSEPTEITSGGSIGIEVRNMQFSEIKVGRIIAFTKYGFFGNQTNNIYTGQHCQDNSIFLGDVAYCGAGLYIESDSAADGAFQVNYVHVQNSFENWVNAQIGASGDVDTNNNIFVFNAVDEPAAGGSAVTVYGLYNHFRIGYFKGTLTFASGSAYNRAEVQVGASDLTLSDSGTRNVVRNAIEGTISPERFLTTGVGTDNAPVQIVSTEAGATFAELIELYRNSASPAANDGAFGICGYFNDSGGNKTRGLRIRTDIPSPTDGAENMRLLIDTMLNGTLGNRFSIWGGVNVGNVADQGSGALNVLTAIYLNSVMVVDGAAGIRLPSYTAANIAAVGNAVNTANKAAGKMVWDTTNNRVMVASGSTAASAWYVADASASVTPS